MSANKIFKGIGIIAVAAVMVSMAACGQGGGSSPSGSTTLEIKNYAEKFVYNRTRSAVTAATKITKLNGAEFISSRGGLIYFSDGQGYGAYSLKKDKIILSGLVAAPTETSVAGVPVLRTFKTSGGQTVYDFTGACDGTKLLTDCTGYYPSATVAELVISGDTAKSEILILSADVLRGGEAERVTKYFKIVRDEESGEISELSGILGEGIAGDIGYTVGGDYNALLRKPVYGDEEVEGEISGYTYGIYGNSYIFYNGAGKETGSVRLADSRFLGFVSDYMYYVTTAPLYPEATGGFNYICDGEKFMYTLNRYDIINNVASTVSFSAIITDFKPLYNKTEKTYDAVVVRGYGQSNGVAYSGYNSFCHITDDQLRSEYDLDIFGGYGSLYSLGEDTYYLGGYIVDGQLSVKTGARVSDIYAEQGLVAIRNSNSMTGFTDFNGKILVAPEFTPDTSCADYTSGEPIKFYGDKAYLLKRSADGVPQKMLVSKSGVTENLGEKERGGAEITVYGGFYLTLTTDTTSACTYEYSAYNGTKLLAITGEGNLSVRCEKVGDGYVIIERRNGETTYYKVG